MNFLLNNQVIKNKRGQIRSGWIILLVWAALYAITDLLSFLSIGLLQNLLSASGHYPSAGEQPDAVFDWVYNIFLPFYMQILYDLVMILTPIAAWCLVMKRSLSSMGLKPVKMRYKELYAGMFLGALCCFTVFFITVVSGQAVVESWVPSFSILQLWWLIVLIFVALGEEIINRGFLMSTLRSVRFLPFIVLVPSFIFGLIHLGNNGVTFFPFVTSFWQGCCFLICIYAQVIYGCASDITSPGTLSRALSLVCLSAELTLPE